MPASAVLGVGFLPAAVLGVIVSKDSATAEVSSNFGKVFAVSENFIKEKGSLKQSDKDQGLIIGDIDGVNLKIKIEKISAGKTRLTVSAHKYMIPKREFASGVIYQISGKF